MMLAIDCEATGLSPHRGASPYCVTTCDEAHEVRTWLWPVDPLTREVAVDRDDLDEIAELVRRAEVVVGQNIKYDAAMFEAVNLLRGEEWPWDKTEDTMVAGHVLASNRPHDLTYMVTEWLGEDIEPLEIALREATMSCRRRVQQARLARKRGKPKPPREDALADWRIKDEGKQWKADAWLCRLLAEHDDLPPDDPMRSVLTDYAEADPETTLMLWIEQRKELERRGLLPHHRVRMKSLPALLDMERRGTTVDRAELRRLKADCELEADKLSSRLIGIALSMGWALELPKGGRNGNLDHFLFDVLRLPPVVNPKAKTDRPCFDAKLAIPWYLENLEPGVELNFVKTFERLQGKNKALGYLDEYERSGVESEPGWLKLHANYKATGTSLLRRSCSEPNLQQVGKKKESNLRRCFGPSPGREWWSLDYKNLELRIPAYEAKEPELMALFERSDEPPYYGSEHLLNFSTVYPDVWEDAVRKVGLDKAGPYCKTEHADTWYQWCKNGDFAVGYGAVDRPDGLGTADRTFRRPGSQARLKERFAKKEEHNQRCIRFANEMGYVETIPDREVCPERGYPLLVTRNDWGKAKPTEPLNFRTQGTAGWIMTKAMNRVAPKLREWTAANPRGYYAIMEVHDELVFDFPAGTGSEPWRTNAAKIVEIKRMMEESGMDVGIPTPVDVDYHVKNWAEGQTISTAMLEQAARAVKKKPIRLIRRGHASVDSQATKTGPKIVRAISRQAEVGAR